VRRYTSPEEHAFFPDCLPPGPLPLLPQLDYPQLLSSINGASSINFNPILLKKYTEWIVPRITMGGDDEQHGSTVLADIAVLQALSRRVHYGKFVAESKYQSDPIGYQQLVDAGDAKGVMERLTNIKVEEKVLKRARLKAATYGREPVAEEDLALLHTNSGIPGNTNEQEKVDPLVIETIYRDFIIPLTKDIEVAYLFRRCGRIPPEQFSPHRMSNDE
jgi:chorismate mutase